MYVLIVIILCETLYSLNDWLLRHFTKKLIWSIGKQHSFVMIGLLLAFASYFVCKWHFSATCMLGLILTWKFMQQISRFNYAVYRVYRFTFHRLTIEKKVCQLYNKLQYILTWGCHAYTAGRCSPVPVVPHAVPVSYLAVHGSVVQYTCIDGFSTLFHLSTACDGINWTPAQLPGCEGVINFFS